MKGLLLLFGLVVVASATPVVDDQRLDNLTLKDKQIFILKLLNHILQPVMYKEIEEIGTTYKIEDNMDFYTRTDCVKRFINNFKIGFLPRGEIFTLHVERQMTEVIDMFHVLYYAKDFTTFLRTACWMRIHLNEGMFVYALTIAVRHRDDCRGIILPTPYEIYPYYFVRADVIQKAYMLKMKRGIIDHKLCEFYGIRKTDKDVYIIDENMYDTRMHLNDNDRLRYFTEDIDLNTYYYYFHVDYPFWMKDDTFNKFRSRRGEVMLYVYQQILARYYLERLSHNMGGIKTLSLYKPVRTGYWPWLKHHNGVEFPVRFNNYVVMRDDNIDVMRLVENYEVIIREAVLKGYIVTTDGLRLDLHKPEDIEVLGKIIYGKVDRYHGDLYRYLLILMKSLMGLNTFKANNYFVAPTVLDHYQTALRDPIFYQLQKRLVDTFLLFKRKLPCYTREEVYFPGVKLDTVNVDKLVTYFDDYLMDMTNAVFLTEDELKKTKSDMTFLVRKRRLNHQPFRITLDIMSDKTIDSVIRIFLGPKEDHMGRLIDINKNRINFIELDSFLYKLTTGKNTVVRNSIDMHNMVRDRVLMRDFWSKVDSATDVRQLVMKDMRNFHTGFPNRLLLPRGRVGGMKMMLYVICTPLRIIDNMDVNVIDTTHKDMINFRSTVLLDKMPLGFPLDRHIDVSKFFTANMKFVDVMIFHKTTTCDMRTRWDRYVLRNYNVERTQTMSEDTYFTDVDITMRKDRESVIDM